MNGTEWWLMLDRVGFHTAWLLLSALWQSSILLAAAGLLAYALRRRRASVRHAILAAAILASPLIPLLGWAALRSGTPQAPIPVMPTYSAPVATVEPAEAAPPVALPPETVTAAPVLTEAPAAPELGQAAAAQPDKAGPREKPFSLLDCPWALALLAYAAGATGLLCLVVVGKYRIGRWARRGQVVTDPRVLGIFRAARERLGLDRDVTVVESRWILSPMTVGTLHPVILLPAGLAEDSCGDDLLAIALHELTHVRRCDSLLLTLLSFVRAALFFHPLVWLACRQVSTLAESACDDAVLDATGEPVSYAKMLARLAEQLPRHALATELAAGIVWSKGAFLRRVEAILSDRRNRIRKLSRAALLGTLAAVVVSVGLALALPLGEKDKAQPATQPATQPGAMTAAEMAREYVRLANAFHAGRYEEVKEAFSDSEAASRGKLGEYRFALLRARNAAARFLKYMYVDREHLKSQTRGEEAAQLQHLSQLCTSAYEQAFRATSSGYERAQVYCQWNDMRRYSKFSAKKSNLLVSGSPFAQRAGSGYTSAPDVAFEGGGGSGATATATVAGGVVTGIAITNGGSGYTSAPDVAFNGGDGSGAAATATIATDAVGAITVTDGGSGYATAPDVAFNGGDGSGAAATAIVAGGQVVGFTVTNSGSGYTSAPTVVLTGGDVASDILGDYAAAAFFRAGYTLPVKTADSRYYHNGSGNIHCGTNVRRAIPSYKWWEK